MCGCVRVCASFYVYHHYLCVWTVFLSHASSTPVCLHVRPDHSSYCPQKWLINKSRTQNNSLLCTQTQTCWHAQGRNIGSLSANIALIILGGLRRCCFFISGHLVHSHFQDIVHHEQIPFLLQCHTLRSKQQKRLCSHTHTQTQKMDKPRPFNPANFGGAQLSRLKSDWEEAERLN